AGNLENIDSELMERRRQRGCSFALKLLRRTRRSQISSKEGTPSPTRQSKMSPLIDARMEGEMATQSESATRDMPPPPPPLHAVKTPQSISPVLPQGEV